MWVISALAITGHLVRMCIKIALLETLASMPSIDGRNIVHAQSHRKCIILYKPFKCGQMVMFPSPMFDNDKIIIMCGSLLWRF